MYISVVFIHTVILAVDKWQDTFCYESSRTAVGPTQPPVQWIPWVLSLGVKRLGREADLSSPCSAEVKE
jgi:hypothetical protein